MREVVIIMIINFSGFHSKTALHATFPQYKNSSFLMLVVSMAWVQDRLARLLGLIQLH